jgi:hypothetical protein
VDDVAVVDQVLAFLYQRGRQDGCTGRATSSPLTSAAPPAAQRVARLTPMLPEEAPRRARGTTMPTKARRASMRARWGSSHEHWT